MANDTKKPASAGPDLSGFVDLGHDLHVWNEGPDGVPIIGWILDRVDHDAKRDPNTSKELMPAYTQLLIRTTYPTMAHGSDKVRKEVPAKTDCLVSIRHGIKVLEKIASLDTLTTEVYIRRGPDRKHPNGVFNIATWDCKVRPVFRELKEIAPEYASLRGFNTAMMKQLPPAREPGEE